MAGMENHDFYTPQEAERILARTDGPITKRRIRQMLASGKLEGFKDEAGRRRIARHEVHRLMEEQRRPPLPAPLLEEPERITELVNALRDQERQLGRLKARTEISEQTESTLREQLEHERERAEQERKRADAERKWAVVERERAERLEPALREERKGFWQRLFGGDR